jgi:hypothetical protein
MLLPTSSRASMGRFLAGFRCSIRSKRQSLDQVLKRKLRLKSLRGIAVVCLGADAGARHGLKTGENAAL